MLTRRHLFRSLLAAPVAAATAAVAPVGGTYSGSLQDMVARDFSITPPREVMEYWNRRAHDQMLRNFHRLFSRQVAALPPLETFAAEPSD